MNWRIRDFGNPNEVELSIFQILPILVSKRVQSHFFNEKAKFYQVVALLVDLLGKETARREPCLPRKPLSHRRHTKFFFIPLARKALPQLY
jgi:hypothetical protein